MQEKRERAGNSEEAYKEGSLKTCPVFPSQLFSSSANDMWVTDSLPLLQKCHNLPQVGGTPKQVDPTSFKVGFNGVWVWYCVMLCCVVLCFEFWLCGCDLIWLGGMGKTTFFCFMIMMMWTTMYLGRNGDPRMRFYLVWFLWQPWPGTWLDDTWQVGYVCLICMYNTIYVGNWLILWFMIKSY